MLEKLENEAGQNGLVISGVASLTGKDGLDHRFQSVALLSPDPNTFWQLFSTSREANDGQPDPIDRWSDRTLVQIASDVGGQAVFPFGGPPYLPFSSWAQRAGVAWQSPSGLLVHAIYGLLVSFRGAVALPQSAAPPPDARSPCETCSRPCLQACPVQAMNDTGFEYMSCLDHVQSPDGADCAEAGCLARRACPIGQHSAPPQQQLRTHMKAFAAGPAD